VLTRIIGSKFLIATLAAVGFAATVSATDVEVKVENYSNNDINVAMAYNHFDGVVATEGWFVIKAGTSRKFKTETDNDLYLRIERAGGKEVTFDKHPTFRFFPVNEGRFQVQKEPDDASIRVLRTGTNLEHRINVNKDGKLPLGWANKRFFRVGSENETLEVKP
jgi:opacity protein-like surface antigen